MTFDKTSHALLILLSKDQPALKVVIVCGMSAIKGLEPALAKEQSWLELKYLPDPFKFLKPDDVKIEVGMIGH